MQEIRFIARKVKDIQQMVVIIQVVRKMMMIEKDERWKKSNIC